MNRESASQMGVNKTGIGLSPIDSQAMLEAARATHVLPDGHEFGAWRVRFAKEAASTIIGSVPPPSTIKGAVKSATEAITGKRPTVLVDHLGARLAFERTGTRLYEAVLAKLDSAGIDGVMRSALERFREQELSHFQVVRSAMELLGVDETAQTPAADVAGVQSSGLIQVVSDPRMSVLHCLDALLTAELRDWESWNMLVGLVDSVGQSKMLPDFKQALAQEQVHLDTVRGWVSRYIETAATMPAED